MRPSIFLVLMALAACSRQDGPPPSFAQTTPSPAQPAKATSAPVAPDFVSLVKREGATVVNISATRTVRGPDLPGLSPEDPFYEFFRRFFPPGPQEYQARGLGSGFIISDDGYILTNAHVVADIDEATVRLVDRREFQAKVVGVDKRTDVALIKIEAKGLRQVTIGDPAKLQAGEWVAAIGSPFGFESSVTAGIVSAKGRFFPDESYVPFIQTDVAVNPGNSGGPLFNLAGQVVGINSMIYSGTGGYMGVSFAIPIDVAMKVAGELRKHGRVIRGRLGVQIQEVTADLAASFGMKSAAGALVVMVEKGGPAEKAGFMPGDVILKAGGRAVERSIDLPPIIGETAPGTTMKFEVWRRGATKELVATIGELPSDATPTAERQERGQANRLGLVLAELTAAQRTELETEGGLLVRSAQGAALKAGIRQGDVIMAINDTRVDRLAAFEKVLAGVPPEGTVALLVLRDGSLVYIPVRLPK